ncbi:MAG: hypothetical protein DRP09_18430 [Candidatus Thorarchaeota archaeon]|nr:MAG: hypothetical protein DRP09_18430 [Candidatus Thorarchaeota archaeon]
MTGNIHQTDKDKLKATVYQAEKDRTIQEPLDIHDESDAITYVTVQKTGTDGDIISAPGTGKKLRIHHIYVVNADDTDTAFKIRNGSGGSPYFAFYLAAYGGAIAQNLKRPWDLSENTALYYDYVTGTTPNTYITIGYEEI